MPYTQVTLSTRDISRPATVRLIPTFALHGLLMSLFFKCACITQQLYFVQLNPPSTIFMCLLCAHSVPRACLTLWPSMFVWFYLLRAKRSVFVFVLCLFCCILLRTWEHVKSNEKTFRITRGPLAWLFLCVRSPSRTFMKMSEAAYRA